MQEEKVATKPQEYNRYGEKQAQLTARVPKELSERLHTVLSRRRQTFANWLYWQARSCVETEEKGETHAASQSPY